MTASFSAQRASLDSQAIVVLAGAGQQVRIACHGAALLDMQIPWQGGTFDIAWGYRSAAQILARSGSHFAVLVPFGGRIADARYTFAGHTHDLAPGAVGAARECRHGFVRDAQFEVAALAATRTEATATLATSAIRPRPGYPFAIDLAVAFTLSAGGLALTAGMRNVGHAAAPCFFGWHAYFRVGTGSVDGWQLAIPARDVLATDAGLIALPGAAAYLPLDEAPAFDFRQPRPIGAAKLDTGYANLARAADGHAHTRLADPASGLAIDVWQERGVMHAFTGDSLAAGARTAIALEPMECMADAFNRPEWADAIRLGAGATREFRCGIRWPHA